MDAAPQLPLAPKTNRSIKQIGFWSAVLTTLWAVAFTLAFAGQALTSPPSTTWLGIDAYAASFDSLSMALVLVPSLLLAPSFLALIACVHGTAREEARTWTRIALALAILYAVIASINYTVQLVVARGNLLAGELGGLGLLVMGNPRSPALGKGTLERWVGRLFLVNAVVSVLAGLNYFVTLDTYHPLRLVASAVWCLAFPAATTLLALRFRV